MTRQSNEREFATWFKDHQATFATLGEEDATNYQVETLAWKQPDSGHMMIRYVIQGSVLMVWGDLEAAVYRWSSRITWDFLAGCDIQYFAGKCEASPKGRTYEDYDAHQALIEFEDSIRQRDEEGYRPLDAELVEDARKAIRYGKDDWYEWMRANGADLFGPDWYEVLPGLGMDIALTCAAHLAGIKAAVAQSKVPRVAAVA